MTDEQTRLVAAISRRLSSTATYDDLLRSAAREAGMSQTAAVLALDAIVDAAASTRP